MDKLKIIPGEMTGTAKFQERDFYGKIEVSTFTRRLYIFLGDFTLSLASVTRDMSTSRRIHTRGNHNLETLQSVENPERILRNRNKENVDFPLFGTSSSQDYIT